MPTERPSKAFCPSTGLAVPECSCRDCLEAMLRDLDPKLLGGEFRLKRTTAGRDQRPNVPGDQPG